ncbi:cytochrome c peroxidase [Ramlibacter sp. AN1015]|uniref:cytochrome-c peroxidase n=1 Tax=Ramlibacter sp. AN1015 TaxID=3133428 RepID=UPI0030C00699
MNTALAAAAAAAAGVALAAIALTVGAAQDGKPRDRWSAQETATLASMQLGGAGPLPSDPSNAYENKAEVAALGRALFNDVRLSRNGTVSCASCHAADNQFQDGRKLGQGLGTGRRRTMPVMGAARSPFLFWDGRKDSLWSQALGPLEDAAEHGTNRVAVVQVLGRAYRQQYQEAFGAFPALEGLPQAASPNGDAAERVAWQSMPPARRDAVNRVFANVGKAIAAYERQVSFGEGRFDTYVAATAAGDGRGQEVLTLQEVRGLRLFLGKGQCVTCHNGPLMTDHAFHNTGVPPLNPIRPDRGRADALDKLMRDEFNCLGPYSDAKPEQCGELRFLATDDPGQLAAFRTPSLRNVALRAPYMHAGQFATIEEVLEHYARSPQAALGHSELAQPGEKHADRQTIRLSQADIQDLAAFLGTLTGPVLQPR